MARPKGAENKDKPFREALRIEVAAAEAEGEGATRSLRKIAQALLDQAAAGNPQAIREVADRLDGKVPQAIGGTEDLPPLKTELTDTELARKIAFILAKATKDKD